MFRRIMQFRESMTESFGRLCAAYKYQAFLLSYQKRDLKIPDVQKKVCNGQVTYILMKLLREEMSEICPFLISFVPSDPNPPRSTSKSTSKFYFLKRLLKVNNGNILSVRTRKC